MIYGASITEAPDLGGQDQSPQCVAMRPPAVPQFPHILARRFFVNIQVRRLEETSHTEEQRFNIPRLFAQKFQWQPLSDEGERQFVLFVTKRCRQLLKKHFIASVTVELVANPVRFLLQPE